MGKTRPMTGITERLNSANVAISNAISDPLMIKMLFQVYCLQG